MRSGEGSSPRAFGASINPQAKAAHLEIHTKYDRDTLGLRPAEWQNSVQVNSPKLYGPPSHLSLNNHITSRHIDPLDFRHLTGPTHQYSSKREAAFTRGDATTGWNFATSVDTCQMKQLLSSSLAVSTKNSKEHKTALKHYRTPIQNSAAVADKAKASRLKAAQQVAALEAKYGKDGAAEMIRIANMHPTGIKRNHKATVYDLESVAALDLSFDRDSLDSA